MACDKFRFYGRYTGLGYRVRHALRRNLQRYADGRAAIHFYDMPSSRFFRRRRIDEPFGVYRQRAALRPAPSGPHLRVALHLAPLFLDLRAILYLLS